MAKYFWEKFSDEELLSLRLCDLELEIDKRVRGFLIAPVLSELRSKAPKHFVPHFWISDEWFCPDGIPGVAIGFTSLHPRLARLEKSQLGFSEGTTKKRFQQLLRHELGHAFDNAFGLRRYNRRKESFGDSRSPYPVYYSPQVYSRSFVRHLGDGYAQSHPDEDFAESFAVWLDPNSEWKTKYSNTGAFEKLMWIDRIAKLLANRKASLSNKRVSAPLSQQRVTLRAFYAAKRRRLGLYVNSGLDRDLEVLTKGPAKGSRVIAHKLIRQGRSHLRKLVAQGTGQPQYRVDEIIRRLAHRSRQLEIQAFGSENEFRQRLLDVVTKQVIENCNSKERTFIM